MSMNRNANEPDLQARLVELETKAAFQDETIETLNAVVTRLQSTVDRLALKLAALETQLRTVAPSLVADRADETPPPHY